MKYEVRFYFNGIYWASRHTDNHAEASEWALIQYEDIDAIVIDGECEELENYIASHRIPSNRIDEIEIEIDIIEE